MNTIWLANDTNAPPTGHLSTEFGEEPLALLAGVVLVLIILAIRGVANRPARGPRDDDD